MDQASLLESLPALQRLALAYAPRPARDAWLGFLVLDARLAQIVRDTREPMLGQIRLAWWRERLHERPEQRPRGEPLLAFLGDDAAGLIPLVDGWEALLGEAPLPQEAFAQFAQGRGQAVGTVAASLGLERADSERLARRWALADLGARLSHPGEREQVAALVEAEGRAPARLPKGMRPLVVLHGVASQRSGAGAMLRAVRLGILGR